MKNFEVQQSWSLPRAKSIGHPSKKHLIPWRLHSTNGIYSSRRVNGFVVFWVGFEVEDNFASFHCAPQKFPRWVLYRGLFEVGLIAVFAEEGPKKGVGLINGLLLVGL